VKRLALVLVVGALVGCGGEDGGRATIWITRDRGAHVILQREVPSGLTAMQALDRVARIETRYAGRYVQAINGLAGSLSARRDWFYFINRYEADRSAAEYRLHRGDVEWWDFRSWRTEMRVPVVVGLFPEPFADGFNGKRRPTVVQYDASTRRQAVALGRRLHAKVVPESAHPDERANVLRLTCVPASSVPRVQARFRSGDEHPGAPILYTVNCTPNFEARARHRYEVGE
jgi:Domain of unknown function (DUF4430)